MHFKPLTGDLWLWGQSYRTDASGRVASHFLAVRSDRYFVTPPEVLARGALAIDGRRVESVVFPLPAGEHAVTYEGPPGSDLHLLWLPRDGKTWSPDFDAEPRFSRVL